RAARRHRHELLRGMDPPAGEPAARDPARSGGALLAAPAAAMRVRRLQRPDRAHRQAQPGRDARRPAGREPDGVGHRLRGAAAAALVALIVSGPLGGSVADDTPTATPTDAPHTPGPKLEPATSLGP